MVNFKRFEELTNKELLEIMKLRQEVFMIEQQIYVVDIDASDSKCHHVFIKDNGQIVSYARVVGQNDDVYVGRIATDKAYRNKGLATKLINYLKERYDVLAISSQIPVIDFYKKLGFQLVGRKYKEAGIWHQKMVYIK